MTYGPNAKPVKISAITDIPEVRVIPPECLATINLLARQYVDAFNAGMPVKNPQQFAEEISLAIAAAAARVR